MSTFSFFFVAEKTSKENQCYCCQPFQFSYQKGRYLQKLPFFSPHFFIIKARPLKKSPQKTERNEQGWWNCVSRIIQRIWTYSRKVVIDSFDLSAFGANSKFIFSMKHTRDWNAFCPCKDSYKVEVFSKLLSSNHSEFLITMFPVTSQLFSFPTYENCPYKNVTRHKQSCSHVWTIAVNMSTKVFQLKGQKNIKRLNYAFLETSRTIMHHDIIKCRTWHWSIYVKLKPMLKVLQLFLFSAQIGTSISGQTNRDNGTDKSDTQQKITLKREKKIL